VIIQNYVMQPQASVGVGVGTVGILETRFHVGDCAVLASDVHWLNFIIFHAIVYVRVWDHKRSIRDLNSLGALVEEELRSQGRFILHRWCPSSYLYKSVSKSLRPPVKCWVPFSLGALDHSSDKLIAWPPFAKATSKAQRPKDLFWSF
jgi:hypothetical protein